MSSPVDILIFAVVLIVLLSALDALAAGLGVDSREMSDDPRRPTYPVSLA